MCVKDVRGHRVRFEWEPSALRLLQKFTERYVTTLFADANLVTLHSRRQTLEPEDLRLVLFYRRDPLSLETLALLRDEDSHN